ncbi:hypothetical protein SLE2022_302360 [Rubroshorea leprosula]
MATDIAFDAALGVAGQLSIAISRVLDTTFAFNAVLAQLQTTLEFVVPKIHRIRWLRDSSDLQNDGIHRLLDLLQQAEKIVNKCSAVTCWNFFNKYRYCKKLLKLDESIRRFFGLELQVVIWEDTVRICNQFDQLILRMDQRVEDPARISPHIKQLKKMISNGSRIKVYQAASELKKIAQSLRGFIFLYLSSFLRIHWWSYRRI